ncbi:MAG: HNH endonuclease [Thermoleophilaceae bacterium]
MRGFLAPTDHGWYQYLRARPELEEVNFWRPGGAGFSALRPGEPFFFKLKTPHNAIGGFGQFARYARLPVWMAWEVFGESNGVGDIEELRGRLTSLSSRSGPLHLDHQIGCIAIAFPTFFAPDDWVPVPPEWKHNIVSGRTYDLTTGAGRVLWTTCVERAVAASAVGGWTAELAHELRYGRPHVVESRLGQGSFRLAVIDAYGRACAVTTEHSLPVLEAAHIRPFNEGGRHEVSNGLPLRRDLHRLFDLGYVTVRPDRTFAVSHQLRDDYANGRVYYELDGRQIAEPTRLDERPAPELLEWHGDVVFRG